MERKDAFDAVADLYARVRPAYPEALVERVLARVARPPAAARLLEVGCGPGTATEAYARRGYRVLCLEPGPRLAALARERLAAYPAVEVLQASFEAWEEEAGAFDLVYAATAWHHVDPAVGYAKAARALRSEGALAIYAHWPVDVFEAGQAAYRRHVPEWGNALPSVEERLARAVAALEGSGCFGGVETARFPWSARLSAAEYLDVLGTFSDHLLLPEATRARLFADLRETIEGQGGTIERRYESVVLLARPVTGAG